jgi:uncharacterized protein YecT (DUF1311 family)
VTPVRVLVVAFALFLATQSHPKGQTADCWNNAKNHGEAVSCEIEKAERQRVMMQGSLDRALAAAKAFHTEGNPDFTSSIEAAQRSWATWMEDECDLEGMLVMGTSAVAALGICQQRMMKSRASELDELSKTLGAGQ